MGIHDAAILYRHGGKHIAVHKESFIFLKAVSFPCGGNGDSTLFYQVDLQSLVPMPGDLGILDIYLMAGVRVLIIQSLYILQLIVQNT